MDRWAVVFLTFLLLPVAAPHAQAQEGAKATLLLEDAPADARLLVGGQSQSPSGRWGAAELVSLSASESVTDLTFTLGVASLDVQNELMLVEDTAYDIVFLLKDSLYRVDLYRQGGQGEFLRGELWQYDPGRGEFYPLSFDLQATSEAAAKTLSVVVPREMLLDGDGNPPTPATRITGFHASSLSGIIGGSSEICIVQCFPMGGYQVEDRMPDSGNGTKPFQFLLGIQQTGHARLFSDVPIRTSNGEATTFVYQVEAQNLGAKKERFGLAAASVPNGWQVRLPAAHIEIPSNGTVLFPVLITIPFSHAHGVLQVVTVELRSSLESSSVGRVQLGVRYAQPPQPAGHHDTVFFHSHKVSYNQLNDALITALGSEDTRFYMNAGEEDLLDDGSPVKSTDCFYTIAGGDYQHCWILPLSPALDLGLDFDLARRGEVTLPVQTTLPISGATLSGSLVYFPAAPPDDTGLPPGWFNEGAVVIASIEPGTPVELAAASGTGQALTATVVPKKEAEYISYRAGASLQLELYLGTGPTSLPLPVSGGFNYANPAALPGGSMRLPLIEYHDKVDNLFAAVSTIEFEATSDQERLVNPGKTVLFNLTLYNYGEDGTFELDLTGTHLPWAAFVTPAERTVELASNGSLEVKVRVTVPANSAGDELGQELADLVVSATSTTDLNLRALARLVARVDAVNTHPDDSALVAALQGELAPKGTPGLEPLAVLATLGAALVLARRRAL